MMTFFAYVGMLFTSLLVLALFAAILYLMELPRSTDRPPYRPNIKR